MENGNNVEEKVERALQKQDILGLQKSMSSFETSLKDGLASVNQGMQVMKENFVHKDDFKEYKSDIGKILANKVDNEDFKPIKNGIYALIMVIIVGLVGAFLVSLGIKS